MKPCTQFLFKISCLAMILAAIVLSRPWDALPPDWNPWRPQNVDQSMTPVMGMKLSRLDGYPLKTSTCAKRCGRG